ncbi:pirin [Hyphomicrobium nitrativorans NL23]|uniref:Pirin n=1 Tax=Hyphomicrobium nitrativorans NL23 TaxID=1029756 RepID=V5SDM4_9HYPH|nr:replication protein RepA [Hyphomicrobium nitrativorans]AHB48971.1 pirin [Hyphomicrobium nitrativorans NL23]
MTFDVEIRDADLVAELDMARETPGFEFKRMELSQKQASRDKLASLSRDARRRELVRRKLEDTPTDADDLRHIHSVLAMCGLPYSRQPLSVREYERKQGRMSLVVEAGKLRNPETGNRIEQPLPFGPKARLLLMHLCSEAIRQQGPTIEVADSLTGFIRDMGFPVTGGKKGTLQAFKEQINALAACKLSVGMWDGRHAVEYQGMPFSRIDVWLPTSPDQMMLWPSTLTFSMDFYTTLAKHALPIRAEAVRAFAGSARKLDMYFWFNYRLHRLRQPLPISWNALAEQFGGDYGRQRDFKRGFADDLKDVLDVFPKLPVKLTEAGMTVSPAGPDALYLPPLRKR